jgi:phage FluMu protein Com
MYKKDEGKKWIEWRCPNIKCKTLHVVMKDEYRTTSEDAQTVFS